MRSNLCWLDRRVTNHDVSNELLCRAGILSFVKRAKHREMEDDDEELSVGAVCIFACAAALESTVNSLLREDGRFSKYDELRLSSKIETIAELANKKIEWGRAPWQEIDKLIRLRNWLAHYKDPNVGLINSSGEWLKDEVNRLPKFDPNVELSQNKITHYYDAARTALHELAIYLNQYHGNYEFLDAEEYTPYLLG